MLLIAPPDERVAWPTTQRGRAEADQRKPRPLVVARDMTHPLTDQTVTEPMMRSQLSVETGPLAPRHRTHHQLPDGSVAPFPHPPACTSPAAEKPAPSRQASSTPTFTNFAMALLPRGRCLDPGPPAYCEVGRPIDPSSSRRAM